MARDLRVSGSAFKTLENVEAFMTKNKLWPRPINPFVLKKHACRDKDADDAYGHIIVGCSGGCDSVALTLILYMLTRPRQIRLHIAHVDHRLRPESPLDTDLVRRLAAELGVPFYLLRADVEGFSKFRKLGIEAAAREIRYFWFDDIRHNLIQGRMPIRNRVLNAEELLELAVLRHRRRKALYRQLNYPEFYELVEEAGEKPFIPHLGVFKEDPLPRRGYEALIAVGHHMEDQAETVLMNMGRGSGLDGVIAMEPRRNFLIRPLLNTSKAELSALIEQLQFGWREDGTNEQPHWRRNRVRNEVLPLLADIFGGDITRRIARLAQNTRPVGEYLEAEVDKYYPKVFRLYPKKGKDRMKFNMNIVLPIGNWTFDADDYYYLYGIVSEWRKLPYIIKIELLRRQYEVMLGSNQNLSSMQIDQMFNILYSSNVLSTLDLADDNKFIRCGNLFVIYPNDQEHLGPYGEEAGEIVL
ncbi:MAG: tRNA lysidine(34) synthetase TilS [Clostridiaceae bacterium]|nr:tRNA lysidine(34) synthetase TilS [Clostridiaceae bacterium]